MLDKHLLVGVYEDSDHLLSSVTKLRKKGVEIFDCYTPFPVHNLDVEMGVKRSNLTIGAFICGLVGFLCGATLQFYMATTVLDSFKSWPMNIGGKPIDEGLLTSMVPVMFELTILFTAFGMATLFFARAKMFHGMKPDIIDPRQTNDRLFLAVEPSKMNISKDEFESICKAEGALEIRERNSETEH